MVFAEIPDERSEINNIFERLLALENDTNNQQQVTDLSIGSGRTSLESFAAVNTGLTQLLTFQPLEQALTKVLSPAGEIPATHTNAIVTHATDDPLNLYHLEDPLHDGQLKILHPEAGKELVIKAGGNFATATDISIADGTFTMALYSQENSNQWLTLATAAGGAGDNLGNHQATIALRMNDNAIFFDTAENQSIIALALANNHVVPVGGAHDFFVNSTIIPKFGITETSIESNVLLDMNSNDIISVDRLQFVSDAGAPLSVLDPTIYVDNIGDGDLVLNNRTTESIIFTFSNVLGGQFSESSLTKERTNGLPLFDIIRSGTVPGTGNSIADMRAYYPRTTSGKTLAGIISFTAEDTTNLGYEGGIAFQVMQAGSQNIWMHMNDSKSNEIQMFRNLDMNANDVKQVDRLLFTQSAGAPDGVGNPQIYVDNIGAGDLVVNNVNTESTVFTFSNVLGGQFSESSLTKERTNGLPFVDIIRSGTVPFAGNTIADLRAFYPRTTAGKTLSSIISFTAEDVGELTYEGGIAFQVMQAGSQNIWMHMNDAASNVIDFFRDLDVNAHYVDIQEMTTPANPAATVRRMFVDAVSGELSVKTNGGTVVSLEAGGSGLTDPMTTRGDIIIRNAANATARLGIGANTFVLTSDGTDISWAAPGAGGEVFVWTNDHDANGNLFILDADGDTIIDASTDDLIRYEIGGIANALQITLATGAAALNWAVANHGHQLSSNTTGMLLSLGANIDDFDIDFGSADKQIKFENNHITSKSDSVAWIMETIYDPTTPADGNAFALYDHNFKNSIGTLESWGQFLWVGWDVTNGTEAAQLKLSLMNDGQLTEMFRFGPEAKSSIVPLLEMFKTDTTPGTGTIAEIKFNANNSDVTMHEFAGIFAQSDLLTAGDEDGALFLHVMSNGGSQNMIVMEGNAGNPEMGFFGATPVPQQSPSSNSASIITALENLGLFV